MYAPAIIHRTPYTQHNRRFIPETKKGWRVRDRVYENMKRTGESVVEQTVYDGCACVKVTSNAVNMHAAF